MFKRFDRKINKDNKQRKKVKRILISILCSTAVVFGYYFSLIILYQAYPVSFDTLDILLIPINIPYNIYKSIFGLYYGSLIMLKILNTAGAILLYSIPFYLGLTLFTKMKKPPEVQGIDEPPKPPVFDNPRSTDVPK